LRFFLVRNASLNEVSRRDRKGQAPSAGIEVRRLPHPNSTRIVPCPPGNLNALPNQWRPAHEETSRPSNRPHRTSGRPAQPDAVGIELLGGSPTDLAHDLTELLGSEHVLHRLSDWCGTPRTRARTGFLAGRPAPRDADDVAALFDYCRRTGRHTTLRSGGTSLNGQSQSDDILIDVRHNWS